MSDVTRRSYEAERRRYRENALSSFRWIESHFAEVQRALEGDSSLILAVGAVRNASGPLSDLTAALSRLQALEEWQFAIAPEEEGS